MKRKSILVLIAVLTLAISVPLYSLATSEVAVPSVPADGIVVDDTQLNTDDVIIGEDGYCYMLDENGDAQRLYARGTGGRYMALRNVDGAYCWALADDNGTTAFQTVRNAFGRGCPRWN